MVFAGGRAIKLGESGLPDIVCVVPPTGHLLGLEVKSAKGKLRPDQVTFRDRLKAVGGTYEVVRSLAQAQIAVARSMGEQTCKLRSKDKFLVNIPR